MKTIEERVTDSIEDALGQVSTSGGYEETFEVKRESRLSDGEAPSQMNLVKVSLISLDASPAPTMPISKDDYLKTHLIHLRVFEPNEGEPDDARASRAAADAYKALMNNRRCIDLVTGMELAIWTNVRSATPIDLNQAVYRGKILVAETLMRTAKDDPYNQ